MSATISGVVTDSSGSVVPRTDLSVTNVSTGINFQTVTDGSGRYVVPTLPAGPYKITAQHAGFDRTIISGIVLDVYQKIDVNVVLRVGPASETVSVEGSASLVDPSSASIGTVVGEEAIRDLPLNLRQIGALALTVPGTVDTTGRAYTTASGNGSGFNDASYSGAGGRSTGNLLLIDGMISRALNNGSFALNPPPEMVKEFKIQNNVYDAAYGITSGTTMNVITESGTNQFHGAAWEFLRNQVLDARNYFATTSNPKYIRNQFGGAIDGPILRDHLFFFGSYEGLRLIQGQTIITRVPNANERAGDLSSYLTGMTANLCAGSGGPAASGMNYDTGQLFDPKSEYTYTCPGSSTTILAGTPIPGNILPQLDPVAQKILALYPSPNYKNPDPTNPSNYINQEPNRRQDDQFDVRIDYSLSSKDTLFGRYLIGNTNQVYPGPFNPFNSFQHFRGHNLVGGWTHIFGPTLLNDLRIGYQKDYLRLSCMGCPRAAGTIASFGITNLAANSNSIEEYPNFTTNNFATFGDGFPGYYPDTLPDSIFRIGDSVTKTIGRETITFGGNIDFWRTNGVQDPAQANGQVNFNGQYASLAGEIPGLSQISDLADLELGYPDYGFYTQHPIITDLTGGRWVSLFVQDNVRLTSNLTVEFGLRWEYRSQPYDSRNQIAAFFPVAKTYQHGDAFLLTPLTSVANDALCSDPYFISATGQCLVLTSSQRRQYGLNGNQVRQVSYGPGHGSFGPRLGVSWRPTNSDRLILHVGGGIFYDLPSTNFFGAYANNNPVFTKTPTFNSAFGAPPVLTNGAPTTTENVFANAPSVGLSQITSQVMPSPFYHTPTVNQWSLSVQSQLAKNLALDLAYVGNRGLHLDNLHVNGNQPVPGSGDLQSRRPWPDFNKVQYDSYDAYSDYHGLLAKMTKRYSNGLSGLLSYTWSKLLDSNGGDSEAVSNPQDDNNQRAEYGVSDSSVRHVLTVSGTYELPFGKGKNYLNDGGLMNTIVGGWSASTIVSFHTGYPFTVNSANDYSNTGSASPRPDRTCQGDGPRKFTQWFDTSCFNTVNLVLPNPPRFGNSGRNILVGPNYNSTDLSLLKRFAIEKMVTEFRAELFNSFNHPNFSTPNAAFPSGLTDGKLAGDTTSFGHLTGALAARDVQFGLKVTF